MRGEKANDRPESTPWADVQAPSADGERSPHPLGDSRPLVHFDPPIGDVFQSNGAGDLLAGIMQRFPGVVWSTDAGLRITGIFGAGVSSLGVSLSDVVGKTLNEFFLSDDVNFSAIAAHLRALRDGRATYELVWRLRYYHAHVERVVDERQRPIGCVGFAQDITERKLAEVEVRRSEILEADERLAITLESIPDGVALLDHQLRFTFVSKATASILKKKPEDLLGKEVSELYPKVARGRVLAELTRSLAMNVPVHFEGYLPQPLDVWYECDCHPTPDRVLVYFRDVTKRKRADEALRQSEARYKALVDTSPDAVVMSDLEGRITFCSPQAVRQYGADCPEQLYGRSAQEFLVEDDHPRFVENLRQLLAEGTRRNDEYTMVRNDGSYFAAELSSAVLRNEAGEPTALMCVVRDVTDRKRADEALRQEQLAVWKMVQASDHERREIANELHDNAAQEMMASLMFFQTFDGWTGIAPESEASLREGIAAVSRASAEIRRLINGIRTPVLDRLGIVAAIEDLTHQFQVKPGAPKIEFRCDVQFGRLASVLGNCLYRMAFELVANACEHSRSKSVRVSLRQAGKELTLEVRDWGIGFKTGTVGEHQFGLIGVRERTRLLGGQMQLITGPEQGTCVQITVPVVEEPEE